MSNFPSIEMRSRRPLLQNIIRRNRRTIVGVTLSISIVYLIISTKQGMKMTNHLLKLSGDGSPSVSLSAMKREADRELVLTPLPKITSQNRSSKFSGSELGILPATRSRNVFYNRIGKCGSRSLVWAVRAIAKLNNFNEVSSPNVWDDHPENDLMYRELKKIAELKPPTFYNRHIHYLDFQNFTRPPPIYINMIRDPISRFVSGFNYMKYGDGEGTVRHPPKNQSHINQCVLNNEPYCRRPKTLFYYTEYFCGFDPICNGKSPIERVELAKKHIDENYYVIGLTEEFENTLKLLEKMMPEYFNGVSTIWKHIGNSLKKKSKTKTKDIPSEEVTQILRHETFVYEYTIYEYVKAKFEQLKAKHGIS